MSRRKEPPPAPSEPETHAFTYTGDEVIYVVPSGVTRLRFHVWGGAGSGGYYSTGRYGGGGGYSRGEMAVSAGDTFTLQVGQGGRYSHTSPSPGGWPDGGAGSYGDTKGGGGGGSSRVFDESGNLVLIGGGGGGSAGFNGNGGAGGGLTGGAGPSAGGGTQSAGGAAGTAGTGVQAGTGPVTYATRADRRGGNGGPQAGSTGSDGGGGGGGYYGGGGGGGDGRAAGGGSGFVAGTLEDTTTIQATAQTPAGQDVVGYTANTAVGTASNTQTPGGDGLILIEENPEPL